MFSLTEFERLPAAMLVSLVNTQLRDYFPSLDELAKYHDISSEDLEHHLTADGYYYEKDLNQFKLR